MERKILIVSTCAVIAILILLFAKLFIYHSENDNKLNSDDYEGKINQISRRARIYCKYRYV